MYLTLIITSSIGIILVFTGFEKSFITGGALGYTGVCVITMPTIDYIGNWSAYVAQEFELFVYANDDNVVTFSDNTTLFDITYDHSNGNQHVGKILFTPNASDIGLHNIIIYINDSVCVDASVSSDNFLLNISASSPVLVPIGDLSAIEDEVFSYDVNASDPNNFPITYNSNVSWFLINPDTGIISFTPTNSEVGSHFIEITANNSYNLKDTEIISFTVTNVNDAPVLDFIPNQYILEDDPFSYDVDASDPDLNVPNAVEVLEFGDNTDLFNINSVDGGIAGPNAGSFNYDKVGDNQTVLIWVSDGEVIDFQYVNFTIVNINDRPIMTLDTAQTVYVNDSFYEYDVEATDEEDGGESTGNLTYTDNTTLFNITSDTGKFNITLDVSLVGTYNINISVNDSDGAITAKILSLTITNENRPPVINSYLPIDLTPTIEETESLDFSITTSDPDGTTPGIRWFLDGVNTNDTDTSYSYTTGYEDAGSHNVTVFVTDGLAIVFLGWDITVTDKAQPAPGPTGGGGGGGGGSGCAPMWVCTDWSPCNIDDIKIRECNDIKGCDYNRPEEVEECIFVPIPTCDDSVKNYHNGGWEILADCGGPCEMCPTCDDGIKNQGEKDIDCGGPCPLCGIEKEIDVPFVPPKERVNWWLFLILILALLIIANIIKKRIKKIVVIKKKGEEKDYLSKINELIKTGKKTIKEKDVNASKQVYNKLEYWYGKLSEDNKKKVYGKIYKFYKKMMEN